MIQFIHGLARQPKLTKTDAAQHQLNTDIVHVLLIGAQQDFDSFVQNGL